MVHDLVWKGAFAEQGPAPHGATPHNGPWECTASVPNCAPSPNSWGPPATLRHFLQSSPHVVVFSPLHPQIHLPQTHTHTHTHTMAHFIRPRLQPGLPLAPGPGGSCVLRRWGVEGVEGAEEGRRQWLMSGWIDSAT